MDLDSIIKESLKGDNNKLEQHCRHATQLLNAKQTQCLQVNKMYIHHIHVLRWIALIPYDPYCIPINQIPFLRIDLYFTMFFNDKIKGFAAKT